MHWHVRKTDFGDPTKHRWSDEKAIHVQIATEIHHNREHSLVSECERSHYQGFEVQLQLFF